MSRFLKLALGAAVALSLAAALVVGCSGDDQAQPQQQQEVEQTQQQQQDDASGSAGAGAAQQQSQPQQQQPDVTQEDEGEPLNVVVSTQVIADWVRQVGGDRVSVRALVPAGADAHTLELSVADIRAIADADLVIINGAGLEAAYEDAILENAERVLNLAEAIEAAGYELDPFGAMMADEHDDHDDHGHEADEDDHAHEDGDDDEMHEDDHDEHGAAAATGRLLITDPDASHLSVLDLTTEELTAGAFEFNAPPLAVYASPTHRYAFVLARGEGDNDDGIHLFDGGVFLVEHDDHYDLFTQPVSRHPLTVTDERPIHFVNSYGWSAVFADAFGYVYLFNEAELAAATGDYQPIVLDTGPQHGAALAISPEHIVVTSNNPDFPENSDSSLPLGVEVRDLDDHVIYDASNRSCPGMHGETHNEDGVIFGCVGGVLYLHPEGDSYHHEWIANPAEMREESRVGSFYGHHHAHNFFGNASYRGEQGFVSDGVWLINAESGEFRQVFTEPLVGGSFGPHGEKLYLLTRTGALHVLDGHDGAELAHVDLFEPDEPASSLIVVGETMFIAHAAHGEIIAVDLDHLEIVETWNVGGAPTRLAFVGVLDADSAPHAGHDDDEMHDEDHDEDEEHDHEEDEDDHGHAHDHGDEDPHFWFDTELAGVAVNAIADELSGLNPAAADGFIDNLERYLGEIADADAEVRALLSDLPDEQRLLVTFHDAFGYFARRYGLTVAGFVVEGPEQGVSAESLAELIELIEHEGVQTVFHEPQFDSNVIDTIADEAGVQRGIIWSQPTDDQPTYLDILLGNARAIAGQ